VNSHLNGLDIVMNWINIDPAEQERRLALWVQREGSWCREDILTPAWHKFTGFFFTPNITVEELLERYAAGERNFTEIRLPEESDLTGSNFAGAVFFGANFSYSNFTNANLTDCDLRYAWIRCNFTGANLEGANIGRADVGGALFKNANLLNTVGCFGHDCGALFEDTIMRDGRVVSYEGRA
jgi:uncharacterized protein YjbI with pentapeptide repeats